MRSFYAVVSTTSKPKEYFRADRKYKKEKFVGPYPEPNLGVSARQSISTTMRNKIRKVSLPKLKFLENE